MILYQRHQRKTKMLYFFKWLKYSIKPDDKTCEHFGFMIERETPHERLFHYSTNKELVLNRLENIYSADESEKCPFIPNINQSLSIHRKYYPISSRTNYKFRSISEEKDYNAKRNINKQSLSTTHYNTNLCYTSLLSNKFNTIDYNLTSKKQSSITPRNVRKQLNKVPNKNKSHSNYFDTTNAEMKYVMNYLTNKSSSSSIFPSYRQPQHQYQIKNNHSKDQSTSSYVNLLSHCERRTPNEANRNKGQLFRGTSRGDSSKLSQYLSESNSYYPHNKNNKEIHYENSSSAHINDKITNYLSQENQTNQLSSTENNCNAKAKNKPLANDRAFFYTLKTNGKGNYSQYKQLKKKNPFIITKQCKNAQILLNKSSKGNNMNDYNYNDELISHSIKQLNYNHTKSNSIENQLNDNKHHTNCEAIRNNKTLQVTSGIVSEYFSDKNNNYRTINNNHCTTPYNNQITLQSLSDSKLYEIANHYITTDESFNRNKCLSNTERKCTKRNNS